MFWLGWWFCSCCLRAGRAFSLPPSITVAAHDDVRARGPEVPSSKSLPPTAHAPGVILPEFLKRPWFSLLSSVPGSNSRLRPRSIYRTVGRIYSDCTDKSFTYIGHTMQGLCSNFRTEALIWYRDRFLSEPGHLRVRLWKHGPSNKNRTAIPVKSR
jgi:hypothetical protein